MSIMLPSLNSAQLSLADVLPSCLSSLGIQQLPNALKLSPVHSSVVVLVDGLGAQNLSTASAHARFLSKKTSLETQLTTVFPSTTAAALASLTTGAHPGKHGMTGYRVLDPESGEILNLLTGLGALTNPSEWLRRKPLYTLAAENGITPSVVAHPRFADTPLTRIIHEGAVQLSAKTIDDRLEATLSTLNQPGQQLIVLYISELDELAHNKGVSSMEWAGALESVDGAIKELSERIPEKVGLFVTADHGVLDVAQPQHFLYGLDVAYMSHISHVGGEPRCLQLYFSEHASDAERAQVVTAWREDWSELAWVLTQEEVVAAGLYGDVASEVLPRLGDVFVLAKKDVAFYDERDTSLKGRNMIGQHGGISPTELNIPGIRLGAYSA